MPIPRNHLTTSRAAACRQPMRVAMLVANAGTGDARVVKEAESLVAAGHAVTVFCLAAAGLPSEEVVAGVVYRRCQEWHRSTRATAVTQKTALPKRSVTLKSLIAAFVRHELNAATFTAAVASHAPTIIHAHDFETLPAAVRAARRCGARVIYDMHELEEGRHPTPGPLLARWKRLVERHALSHVSAVLTVSPSIARYKARVYDIPLPTVVLNAPRLGASATGPDLRQRCGLAAGVPLAVYAGTASQGRGIEHLIEAIEQHGVMHLAMLGTIRPALRPLLERARTRLAGRLHLLDPVPHDHVVAHIASADLGVCTIPGTCLSYEYCLPNKLFEMTLAGLPVLVARTTELQRFIAETGNGIAVDAADPAAICAGLAEVYATRESLRPNEAALASLRARFSWDRQSERLLDVYDAVSNGPQGLPAAMARRALATAWRPLGSPTGAHGSGG